MDSERTKESGVQVNIVIDGEWITYVYKDGRLT